MRKANAIVTVATLASVGAALTTAALAQGVPNFKDERRLPPTVAPVTSSPSASVTTALDAKKRADEEAELRRKSEDDAKRLVDLETKRKAEEETRRLAEAEAKQKIAEDARQLAEAARKKADDEARRSEEAEVKRKADEEAKRLAAAASRQLAEEMARRKAEAEAQRKADESAKLVAEAELRKAAENEARRLAKLEAAKRADDENKRLAEVAARKKADDEARDQADRDAKKRAEVEESRRVADAEAKRKSEADIKRIAEAIAAKTAEDERLKEATRAFAGSADASRLLTRGRQFITSGDIASARLLFERAADAGSAEAARELAASFDTDTLVRQQFSASEANPQLVLSWTKRAEALQALADADVRRQAEESARRIAAATAARQKLQDQNAEDERVRVAAARETRLQAADPATERQRNISAAQTTTSRPSPSVVGTPLAAPSSTEVAVAPSAPTLISPPRAASPLTLRPTLPVIAGVQVPSTPSDSDAARYLSRGRTLLQRGDLVSARAFFERAADSQSAEAAIEMARTYDPTVIASAASTIVGVQSDAAQALRWYERAQALGAKGLSETLQRLVRP